MALNFHVNSTDLASPSRVISIMHNMLGNKDQMIVSVIRSIYMFGKATIKFSFQTECIS
ncbi:conserved hypothetical protein [Trichinella spiralis]|uniref:hypothetical protein n=1 Tax=Trichinella spiralis TaxID=6334 RepID=UPI0001EFC93B|nr:conserved hypothetical protein [Trichinella spiralis]